MPFFAYSAGSVRNAATVSPDGSGAQYHQPSGALSTSVRRSGGATPSCATRKKIATSASSTMRRPSPSKRSPLRPLASTTKRAAIAASAAPVSIRHVPPPVRAQRATRTAVSTCAPASAAARQSSASNALRSTCHPVPNRLATKSVSCRSREPHAQTVPGDASAPDAANASHTPSARSSGLASGGSVSPNRGASNEVASSTTTPCPRSASARATAAPAGPPPITATSYAAAGLDGPRVASLLIGRPFSQEPHGLLPRAAASKGVDVDVQGIVSAKIHPAIGIARVGNSPDEHLVGPELANPVPPPPGGYKDAQGRLKRQAAQFRIYGYDAQGAVVG